MRRKQEQLGRIGDYYLSRRDNSPAWCRTWYDDTSRQTRRVSLDTTDFAEARRRLGDWYAHNVTLKRAEPEQAKLADIVLRYWTDHARHVRSGYSQSIHLDKCLGLIGRDIYVSEFTPTVQRQLLAKLGRDHKPAGVNRYFGAIKAAIRWGLAEELIASHPPLRGNVEVGEGPSRVLTISELAALWDAAEETYTQAFLMVVLCTMCRHEAALQLTRLQCDLERDTIKLNPEGRTQTKKRRPVILLARALRPWVIISGGHIVEKNGRPIKSCSIPFRRAREHAGLDEQVTPTAIRRTMATMLDAQGISDLQIGAFMGHRAVNSTTAKHYIKPNVDFLEGVRNAIDSIVSEMGRIAVRPISPETQNVRASCVLAV
jgi:integrase